MASGSGQAPVPRAVTASALSRATRPFTLGRWIGWVTASESLGFLVPSTGLAVASLVPIAGWEAYVMIVMLGAVEGALLGLGQVAGLRDTVGAVPLGPWVTVTAGGAAVAWSLGMLPATLSDVGVSVDFTLPATWFAFGLGGLALLTAIPVAQWPVLRDVLPRAWRWIPVGVGAWLAGLVFPFLPGPFVDESTSPLELAVLFALAALAMAATVATVTGLWLRRVLPHR